MQKIAQKRGLFNKLRDLSNIPGSAVESFFKPELNRIMNDLRVADDTIRTIFVGTDVGSPDLSITPDGQPIKEILKSAQQNLNRREYMAAIFDLGKFHKKLFDATKYVSKLDLSVNKIHDKFLMGGSEDEQEKRKEHIRNLQQHMSRAFYLQPYFIKEAGIMDFFHNIGTKRGRALAAWEKRYPKVAKEIREGATRLVAQANNSWANVLASLKTMATARAVRKVDDYMAAAQRIITEYQKFDSGDKGFRSYYNNVITPFIKRWDAEHPEDKPTEKITYRKSLDQMTDIERKDEEERSYLYTMRKTYPDWDQMTDIERNKASEEYQKKWDEDEKLESEYNKLSPEEKKKFRNSELFKEYKRNSHSISNPDAKEMGQQEVGQMVPPPNGTSSPLPSQTPVVGPPQMSVPAPEIPKAPAVPNFDDGQFKSERLVQQYAEEAKKRREEYEKSLQKQQHARFLTSLEALSNEDPRIVASHICKYAKQIKAKQPELAIELLTVAHQLKA